MGRRITIEPVTRIEGHARVTIELGEDGRVADARVHVTELRGVEALCAGRLLGELPALTARICGICPVSHALASASATDAVLGATPPPAARRLRAAVQLAQRVQSHALSFFYLSAPDLHLPAEVEPARRSVFGLAERLPALARDGIALRRFGGSVVESIAGRRVHAAFAVPGGVTRPLDAATRDAVLAELPAAMAAARRTLDGWWSRLPALAGRERDLEETGGCFLALAGPGGALADAGGTLRAVSTRGEVLVDGLDPSRYADVIAEDVEPWTYPKLARWLQPGRAPGVIRVGPLARLNVATRCGTPRADAELARFRTLGAPVLSTFHAHLARLVEIVHALERLEELLADPEALDPDVLGSPGTRRTEGVGACEAPRGTVFHHYRVDGDGLVTWVNLVVATGLNGLAMDRAVRRVAERALTGGRIDDALAGRVQEALRAFDPCLSCATHAAGGGGVTLRLVGPRGEVLDERE